MVIKRTYERNEKVLLLAAGNDYCRDEWSLSVIPPMGILSIGSFLAEQGVPVELIDVQSDFGFGLTEASGRVVLQRVAWYISDQSDDIAWVGLSQLSNTNQGVALAKEIHAKLPEIPIVFGGYSPSGN